MSHWLSHVGFLLPLAVLVAAAKRCFEAAGRARGHRRAWIVLGIATALAGGASGAGLAAGVLGYPVDTAFYLGSGASVLLILGAAILARRSLANAGFEVLVEALIFAVLVAAVSVYFVVLPGVSDGYTMLTAVFLVDIGALLLAGLAAIAGERLEQRRIAWGVTAACAAAATGDGLVAAAAAGQVADAPAATAALWAAAGVGLILAAQQETGDEGSDPEAPVASETPGEGWIYTRLLLPMGAVLAIPAVALAAWALDALKPWGVAFFAGFFALELLLVFGRQGYLLVGNRRAIFRERRLRREMTRRNRDLRALTGLASTMTETLEEEATVERGLDVLKLAARASSAALHMRTDGAFELAGAAGSWEEEQGVAGSLEAEEAKPTVARRGDSYVFRLPLEARGIRLGVVTLVRPASEEFDDEELQRMALLSTQLAIAVQNARDYRERLEQAIRDPLTGTYNRRFFYEALGKEVNRQARYGSPLSMVIFDIDDFKAINDTYGHATGDEVLRILTTIADEMIRLTDSFARLGGEEFGLLLPETQQLDALLVADRLRAAVARHEIIPGRRVTVSAGIASCPQDATTAEELEKAADTALYWAKDNGKNICVVASEVIGGGATLDSGDQNELSQLNALVSTIDSQPLHTRDHSENVAAYAVAIGQELGLEHERIVKLRRAAFYHDIGKIGVPREILAKPASLDGTEWEEVKTHPTVGESILEHAGFAEEARWVGQHHERLDGTGYPHGRGGDEIALESRIIFVADAFEAITSDRPYRRGRTPEEAVAELRLNSGSQFDPDVVEAIAALVGEDRLAVLALRG